jgi:hypothetical protein
LHDAWRKRYFHAQDGPTNPADVGTKGGSKTKAAMEKLTELIAHGKYSPMGSNDYQNTFGANEVKEIAYLISQSLDDFGFF